MESTRLLLDNGDLGAHARTVRRLLGDGGLSDMSIFASGKRVWWRCLARPATLQVCRDGHTAQRRLLPERLRALGSAPTAFEAQVSERVHSLTAALDAATA